MTVKKERAEEEKTVFKNSAPKPKTKPVKPAKLIPEKERSEAEKTVLKKPVRTRKPKPIVEEVKPVKRDLEKELREYRFDKKMVETVAEEMKQWIHFCFMSFGERMDIATIIIKAYQENRWDKKMVETVAEEMEQWFNFCFMPLEERMTIAAIVIKASQDYDSKKIHSSNIMDQSDAILAMAKRFGC